MKKNLVQFQVWIDNVEIRAEDGKVIIEGYASTPDVDRYNSIITTEAIASGMENYLKNPVILLGHDMDKPIGKMVSYNVENGGLRIKAEISQDTDGIMKAIKDGVVKGFSIGFYALAWSYETKQGIPLSALSETEIDNLSYEDIVRKINKIELLEISVVALPANPNALFTLTRALKDFFEKHEKRSAIKNIRDVTGDEEEVLGEETEEVKEVTAEVVEETQEEGQEENKEGVSDENIQGDEGEVTGENPEPQTEANDPAETVESTENTETIETLKARIGELEGEKSVLEEQVRNLEDKVLESVEIAEKMQRALEKKTIKVSELQGQLDRIPSKRGLVNTGPVTKPVDVLSSELASAKAHATGN